jgi:hypothetical protein
MRRIKSSDADLSHDDLVQVIRLAEIAREQFLRENSGSALRGIGWITLAFGLTLLVVAGSGPSPRQILENTTLLEQLATKLRPMEKIAPGTVGQITELLRRPDYDCRDVRCDAALEKRNAAARLELERVLVNHSGPATLAATK